MYMLEAYWGTSWEPDFLTLFKIADSDKPGSQAKFWVFDHLIGINKMAVKLSSFYFSWIILYGYAVTRM